ncbi:MAG: GFA family protein [Myxococcota bacterium]|nr:GFA family protein [Myxococcota bacterium]
MLRGSCACGEVRYEIDGELVGPMSYCHCWQCRKHSGSSFGTTCAVKADDLRVVAGAERLRSWESSPGIHRFFASCCGSPVYKRRDDIPAVLGLRLGTLDSDPGRQVEDHVFVGSKAPWVEIADALPRQSEGAPFPQRG